MKVRWHSGLVYYAVLLGGLGSNPTCLLFSDIWFISDIDNEKAILPWN